MTCRILHLADVRLKQFWISWWSGFLPRDLCSFTPTHRTATYVSARLLSVYTRHHAIDSTISPLLLFYTPCHIRTRISAILRAALQNPLMHKLRTVRSIGYVEPHTLYPTENFREASCELRGHQSSCSNLGSQIGTRAIFRVHV